MKQKLTLPSQMFLIFGNLSSSSHPDMWSTGGEKQAEWYRIKVIIYIGLFIGS